MIRLEYDCALSVRSLINSQSSLILISVNALVLYRGSGLESIVSSIANLDRSILLRVSIRGNM